MASRKTTAPCSLLWSMLTVCVAHLVAVATVTAAGDCGSVSLAVGSYTGVSWINNPPASGEGVTLLDLELCNSQGSLSATLVKAGLIPATETGENPAYCDQFDNSTIICGNEISAPGTATMVGSAVNSSVPSQKFDLGVDKPAHINVLGNGVVATANFGGSFGTFDPSLGSTAAVVQTITVPETNGTEPHPHMILETTEGEIVVTDLGLDAVYQYSVALDGSLTSTGTTILPVDSGPRHAALGKGGKVYVAAEKSLQIIELGSDCVEGSEDTARGICGFKQLPSTLSGTTLANIAAIRVSKDQEFVYVSMREDSAGAGGAIVGLKLGLDGSLGELVGTWSSGGKTPRDFNLVDVPGFKEVFVVANRKSNTVVVFDRNEATGVQGSELASAAVNTPTSILVLAGDDEIDSAASAEAPGAEAPGAAAPAVAADADVPADQSGASGVDSADMTADGVDAPIPSVAAGATCQIVLAVIAVLFITL